MNAREVSSITRGKLSLSSYVGAFLLALAIYGGTFIAVRAASALLVTQLHTELLSGAENAMMLQGLQERTERILLWMRTIFIGVPLVSLVLALVLWKRQTFWAATFLFVFLLGVLYYSPFILLWLLGVEEL